MLVLVSWLKDFVEISEHPQELGEALTMAGLAVDGVEERGGETVLELDITSNRPDAMNHFGVAREISAIYRRPLKRPVIEIAEAARESSSAASIEILDSDLCSRYVGRVALGVEVKPAPDWMRRRIELCGIRSINNIADLTNYVLLEIGHPTHAFDLDTIGKSRIVVRRAVAGEEIRTLDGVDHKLESEHLVIADGYKPVALAGVMGGLETEISDQTKNILIEAAWFKPGLIRKTSRQFGMHTEASHRFERGADVGCASWAADRIAGLLAEVSPGVALRGSIDVYPGQSEPKTVVLRRQRLDRIIGAEIPDGDVVEILTNLGFEPRSTDGGWETPIPTHRLDVEREIDLIEEVGRIYGYGRVVSTLPPFGSAPEAAPHAAEERAARQTLRGLGYDETIGLALAGDVESKRFSSDEPILVRNPFSEVYNSLRTSAVPTMLKAIERNVHRNQPEVKLVEFGRLYRRGEGGYQEPNVIALAATGAQRPAGVFEQAKGVDFYDLKADLAVLLARFDIEHLEYDDRDLPDYYLEVSAARVQSEHGILAMLGQVEPAICAERKIHQPVFVAEIFADALYGASLRRLGHRPIPKTPAVQRDLSLFVPDGIRFGDVRGAIGVMEDLVSVEPVEVLRGELAPAGHYGLLLRATWQREGASLTDEQVNGYADAIRDGLQTKLKVRLR